MGSVITYTIINYNIFVVITSLYILLAIYFLFLIIYLYNAGYNNISLNILEIKYDKDLRCLNFTMSNPTGLEGKELFKALYNSLTNNQEYLNFGFKKVIIISAILDTLQEFNLHSNILVDNLTSFEDYYLYISKELNNYYNLEYGYSSETIIRFVVKVWNVDNKQNLHIKQTHNTLKWSRRYFNQQNISPSSLRLFSTSTITKASHWSKGLITPLSLYKNNGKLKLENPKPFFTMDLETINFNNIQVPIAISSSSANESKLFLIDHVLLQSNSELAVKQLWSKYFTYLEKLDVNLIGQGLTIFAHNLGKFDGYFLYKALMNHYNPDIITSIIDDSNTFISIKLNTSIPFEWKDSLRIFPISLDKLCKVFGVDGKLIPYNPKFNSIDLFKSPKLWSTFKNYSLQDAIALYKALFIAQLTYFNLFKVDIESIYSTATLSLKIFRAKFLDKDIFILPEYIDGFIRDAYFGGGTDVYKAYAENVSYYDVNSLYPNSMLEPMPYNLISSKLINLRGRSLDSFFGFAKVYINCPKSMLRPVLPFHFEGKTIYPVGTWIGTYFSEELKAVEKLGYKITLIQGYEFTQVDLFTKYVNTFFNIKKNSEGAEKLIAKLLLNNLYGYFGRKQISILTQNVKNSNLADIVISKIVKSITTINDEYSTVLTYSNINYNLLEKLNNVFQNEIKSFNTPIKSNVAIAAAVTAYSRIHMIPFKLDPNTLYTDTDSIFTTKPIDPALIGDGLGQMKDELKGKVIREALFLGPKKYGYYIIDENNNIQNFSVFAGVPRNSLTFQEVTDIFNGKVITKSVPNRFFKSFKDLSIDIKDTTIFFKNIPHKILVNNIYLLALPCFARVRASCY